MAAEASGDFPVEPSPIYAGEESFGIGVRVLRELGLDERHALCDEIGPQLFGLYHSWQIARMAPQATSPHTAIFDAGCIERITAHIQLHELPSEEPFRVGEAVVSIVQEH